MALIDSDAGEIVIRVVYDGPPEAGKTTSLRALAGSLSQPTFTPAEDNGGRTLWFDWMEYVGGRFEGCQIRCQIMSVPGQRNLAGRRRRILESADVVVFVNDSAASQLDETLTYLGELQAMIADRDIPVGVILQANKRDLPGAVKLDTLRDRIAAAGWPIGVVESIASQGTGIREAFIYAVRLALDRVREQLQHQSLPSGGARTADELLAALQQGEHEADAPAAGRARTEADPPLEADSDTVVASPEDDDSEGWIDERATPPLASAAEAERGSIDERGTPPLVSAAEAQRGSIATPPVDGPPRADSQAVPEETDMFETERAERTESVIESEWDAVAAELFRDVIAEENAATEGKLLTLTGVPKPPDASVPSGAIWPPVEGRAILAELADVALMPRRLANGDWAAGLGTGWRVVSSAAATFESLDAGRAALIAWARLHASANGVLSPTRCIVIADSGEGGWRLWQIVRAETSLRDAIDEAFDEDDDDKLIARLAHIAQLLIEGEDKVAATPLGLACTLDSIGESAAESGGAVYLGLMPEDGAPVEPRPRRQREALIAAELAPAVEGDLRDRGIELDQVMARVTARLERDLSMLA